MIHVSDVSAPGVKILNDPDIVLVTVVAPTAAALPEGEEEGVEAGEAEPEVIRRREGGEDEEG